MMIFSYHYGSALRDPEPERIVLTQERLQKCFDANKICIQNMHFCIFTGAGNILFTFSKSPDSHACSNILA